MTDFHQKCPECGSLEIWDADCPACEGSQHQEDGEDCPECEGSGHQEGICECSICGIEDSADAFDAPTQPTAATPTHNQE
mgnify:CR=1 FL=1